MPQVKSMHAKHTTCSRFPRDSSRMLASVTEAATTAILVGPVRQSTWEAPRCVPCEAGEEAAADPVHLDLVFHAKALEAFPSVEQVPADCT